MKNFFLFLIGAVIGAALVYLFCCKTETMKNDLTEPRGIITTEQMETLDQAFDSRHQLISDSIVKRPDNRSSWYSLEDLRTYLKIAEKQATGLGYKMNGVRLYLGAYPDTANEVGYTTMFFSPTGVLAKTAEGSMISLNLNTQTGPFPDIPGGKGFNMGEPGFPPKANYPQ